MLSSRLNAPASMFFPATRNDGFNFKYLELLMSLQSSAKIRHSFSNCRFSSGGAPHLLETLGGKAQRFPILTE